MQCFHKPHYENECDKVTTTYNFKIHATLLWASKESFGVSLTIPVVMKKNANNPLRRPRVIFAHPLIFLFFSENNIINIELVKKKKL